MKGVNINSGQGGGGGIADGDKGDITVSGGGAVWTVDASAITLGKMASLAPNSIIGNNTGSVATPVALTSAQVRAMLNVADGATANATDAALRDRATHTGTQAASTISDFNATSRAQTEAELIAGTNITITPAGSGATRTLTIAAAGGGAADPLNLTVASPSLPGANTVTLFRRAIASRQMPAFAGFTGLDSALQPLLARNKVGIWSPPGNGTTVPGVIGMAALTVTGFTATARNVATTNLFTRMRRLGYVSAATAAAVGQFRAPSAQFTIGNGAGLGGFFLVVRFGISDAVLVSGARMFMGVQANATPTNVEPSTLVNCIGIGHGAADTTLRLYSGGSAAQTPIDLGVNFPTNTTSVDMYELALFAPPSSSVVHYEVTRLNTNHVATGTLSGTPGTQLPATTTLLAAPWGYRTNNATAAAVAIDVVSVYIETDY